MISPANHQVDDNDAPVGFASPNDYYRFGRQRSLPDENDSDSFMVNSKNSENSLNSYGNYTTDSSSNETSMHEFVADLRLNEIDSLPSAGDKSEKIRKRRRIIVRPPEILQRLPQSLSFSEGESLDLQCQVYGIPKPEISWLRESDVLQEDDRTMFLNDAENSSTYGLVINNTTVEDEGTYKVVAKNEAGEASSATYVEIKAKPTDQAIFVHRRQISSIPEERLDEEDTELIAHLAALKESEETPVSTVVTKFTNTMYTSKSIVSPTVEFDERGADWDYSDQVSSSSVKVVQPVFGAPASGQSDRRNNTSITSPSNLPAARSLRVQPQPDDAAQKKTTDLSGLYFSALAIQTTCFATMLFLSRSNDLLTDLRQFSACLALLVFLCFYSRK